MHPSEGMLGLAVCQVSGKHTIGFGILGTLGLTLARLKHY
jgi:hypothetical protein